MSTRYSGSRYGGGNEKEDVNPMNWVGNLADVMLVLAVGIMLALVINWNIDVTPKDSQTTADKTGEEISEIEGFASDGETPLDSDAEYEEMGVVYRDPVSGKYYLVEKPDAQN